MRGCPHLLSLGEPGALRGPSGFRPLLRKVCATRGQLRGGVFPRQALTVIDIAMHSGRPERALHKPYDTPAVPGDAYKLHCMQERMGQILTSAPLASDRSSSIQTRPNKT